MRTKLQELESSKAWLEDELASLNTAASAPVKIHPNVPYLYRRRVAALAELLEDESTRPEAMDAIRSLVDWIEVGLPEAEREPRTVTLVGALASVLAFVSEQEDRGRQAIAAAGASHPDQNGRAARHAEQNGGPFQDRRSNARTHGTSLVVAGARFGHWLQLGRASNLQASSYGLP